MTALAFGTDSLCRFCGGSGQRQHTHYKYIGPADCLHCSGTGLEPGQKAVARRSDPETSREAAASISSERLRASQTAVLHAIKATGGMTDDALIRHPYITSWRMSPSGARTRRAELVARGLVYDTGKRETLASGRKAVVWGAR